ncbi:hypothetical protein KXX11_004117, partial [Aspergillus fumigatus]
RGAPGPGAVDGRDGRHRGATSTPTAARRAARNTPDRQRNERRETQRRAAGEHPHGALLRRQERQGDARGPEAAAVRQRRLPRDRRPRHRLHRPVRGVHQGAPPRPHGGHPQRRGRAPRRHLQEGTGQPLRHARRRQLRLRAVGAAQVRAAAELQERAGAG